MTGQPNDQQPEPPGGRAAERLHDFLMGRFPDQIPPSDEIPSTHPDGQADEDTAEQVAEQANQQIVNQADQTICESNDEPIPETACDPVDDQTIAIDRPIENKNLPEEKDEKKE